MTGVEDHGPCPLCGLRLRSARGENFWRDVTCRRCGEFTVSTQLVKLLLSVSAERKALLSAAARQAHEVHAPLRLNTNNWEQLIEGRDALSVSRKIEKLLLWVGSNCARPGHLMGIDCDLDYPIADCGDGTEFRQYLEHLVEEQELIRQYGDDAGNPSNIYGLTIKGWQVIEPTLPQGGEPGRCFVAMWFHDDLDAVWASGFEPGIRDAGFVPYRVKGDPTNRPVIDRIIAEIRRAQFVVADFTGNRQSVYYEAGFAAGLGREVIGCCRSDHTEGLAFDTRHLGHVVWKEPSDLRENLANSIRAIIIPKR
jgi:hypothetical protein